MDRQILWINLFTIPPANAKRVLGASPAGHILKDVMKHESGEGKRDASELNPWSET